MMEYIKRLRICIKWFQELEENLLLEQEKNGKMLESAINRCNDMGINNNNHTFKNIFFII